MTSLEGPNFNIQASENLQAPNPQIARSSRGPFPAIADWTLEFLWSLVLGTWMFRDLFINPIPRSPALD